MSAKGKSQKADARPPVTDVKWSVRVGGETITVTAAEIDHHYGQWTSLVNAAGDTVFESPCIAWIRRESADATGDFTRRALELDDDPRKPGTAKAARGA